MNQYCEHGIHLQIICLQCQAKRQAENKKSYASENLRPTDRERALARIKKQAKELDW